MSAALDDFIAEARALPLDVALAKAEVALKGRGAEKTGPCPVCGGKDRFSVNAAKGLWFCRQADRGGDGLALMAYRFGHDLASRVGLLAACAELLGRPVPDGGAVESEADRAAREARLADAAQKRASEQAGKKAAQDRHRALELGRARGIWENARPIDGSAAIAYLSLRTGLSDGDLAERLAMLRFSASQSYWHGLDERGQADCIHTGPAMIAPFIDARGQVTGCHITWIDLSAAPKFRPELWRSDERLPTKKMRGHKKGSLIPVIGDMFAARWVVGEGIETVLAVAWAESFRADTFYAAAGDLGNMAGPADPRSAFNHPDLKKTDKAGRIKPVRVPGPVPAEGEGDAFVALDHVVEIVLLADGDSERFMTASAMVRAQARLTRPGRQVDIWWPPEGMDFADAIKGRAA